MFCAIQSGILKFTSEIFHHGVMVQVKRMGKAYSDNAGIIGHNRGPALLGRLWGVINPQVLNIGAAKDNVVVDLIRGGDLVIGIASAALAAKGFDILERDGRLFGVDLVEDTGVAGES